jgi:uncharacterized protein YndB with AHSA1/START domain
VIVDGVVVHEHVYPHPIERVWKALTDRADLATWLMANDAVSQVGVRFRFDGGRDLSLVEVEVIELVAPSRLVWDWTSGGRRSRVRIDLAETDGATTLRLEHRMLPPADAAGFDVGWSDKLTTDLAALLTGEHHSGDSVIRAGLTCHPRFDHLTHHDVTSHATRYDAGEVL